MLILTRRAGETIMVGDEVTITVLEMRGGQVKIGINAPKEVSVHREEIYQRIAESSTDSENTVPNTAYSSTPNPSEVSGAESASRSTPVIKYKKSRS